MPPFSFPALTAGPPSRRNWYQELLDHPDCHGPQQVSEAYASHRDAYTAKNRPLFTADTNPVTPDQALLSHLARQTNSQAPGEPSLKEMEDLDVNCLGMCARPSESVVAKVKDIQERIGNLVGHDFYPMPAADLHIAMVEQAHRHSLSYLHGIADSVGKDRLQQMLDLVSTLPAKPRLVSPRLSFDPMGIALTFLPDATQEYTYHHLRAAMHAIALESGESFDMCYTAPSAHVTLGRFRGNVFFGDEKRRREFVELVDGVNGELERGKEGWEVGGLELQMGYLKYGVGRERAEMLGRV